MSTEYDLEINTLLRTDRRRMEIQGYTYSPHGGWESNELKEAYKKAWRNSGLGLESEPNQEAKAGKIKKAKKKKTEKVKTTKKGSKSKVGALSDDLFTEGGVGAAFYKDYSSKLVAVREWKSWAEYQTKTGLWQSVASEEVAARLLDWFEGGLFQAAQHDSKIVKNKRTMAKVRRFRELTPCNNAARYAFGKAKVSSSIFDADADALLTADGAIDLKKGKLRKPRAEDYFTRKARAGYEPGYTDPLWDEILTALPEYVADYLQIVVGNALTGHTLNQSMVFFFSGDGSNGKSTLTDVLKKMLGTYADRVDSSILLNAGDSNLFGKAKLKALRAAFIEELPKSNWLDALIIKELAETAEMTAAKKFQDEETFDFTATVFVNTNYLPQVSENDRGTWRRLAPVPMPYTYVSAEEYDRTPDAYNMGMRKKNPALADAQKNASILKAALAWAVEGARKWYEAGCVEPPMPAAMEEAKKKWRGGQDKVELWWNERIVADPNSFCLMADLHDTFELEMAEIGRPAEKNRKFMEMLQAHPRFKEAKAEYVQRQRAPKSLIQSLYTPEKKTNSPYELPPETRTPKGTCFYVKGIRFRTEADDQTEEEIEVPNTAEELTSELMEDYDDEELADVFD